jgi:hypothetical protein
MFSMPSPSSFLPNMVIQRGAKQLLLDKARRDIAQKHPASRFIPTTGP